MLTPAVFQSVPRARFTAEDDRLPPMFYNEPLPPYNVIVKVSDAQMDETFQSLKPTKQARFISTADVRKQPDQQISEDFDAFVC